MVEFVLLFALGFLSAILIGLMAAPAIHARIVRFTEHRMRATVPMSRAELRAERDMERAEYAARSQGLAVDLRNERTRRIELTKIADRLRETAARLRGEMADLERQVETMRVEAGNMRSMLRSGEMREAAATLSLADAQRTIADRERHVHELQKDVRRLSIEAEDARIDLATSETEAESLKSSLSMLGEEKRRLNARLGEVEAALKDKTYRLAREEERNADLDRRLADAMARMTDQENTLERRTAEIERLREKLKATGEALRDAEETLRRFGGEPRSQADPEEEEAPMNGHAIEVGEEAVAGSDKSAAINHRIDKLRARHTALVDRLVAANDPGDDGVLREEIKDIAASMVSLTARREGPESPIHKLLAETASEEEGSSRRSLAARASAMLRDG